MERTLEQRTIAKVSWRLSASQTDASMQHF